MEFHEILNKLMDKHNFRAVDLCSRVGLNRSYISKVRSGQLLPSDYQVVVDISDSMMLNAEERTELTGAYQAKKTSSGKRMAWETFNNLYCLKYPTIKQLDNIEISGLKNGDIISDRDSLLQTVIAIVSEEKQNVKIILAPISDELRRFAENIFVAAPESVEIEWIIPMDKTDINSELNMTSFVNTLFALLVHKADVKELKTDIDIFLGSSVFPFIIMSDSIVLLIDEKAENGLYFDSVESLLLYQNKFNDFLEASVPFLRTYNSAESFLRDMAYIALPSNETKDSELYILKKAPCLVLESSTVDIHTYIADFENSDKIANMYIEFLCATANHQSKMVNIFLEAGIDEYLNSEDFYEVGRYFTKSIPVELRKRLLINMLHMAETDEVVPLMLRLPGLSQSSLYVINIWSDGRMIFVYDFDNQCQIFTAFEPSIAAAFIGYINTLRSCGIIHSKEATVEIIKRAMEKQID